MDQIFRSTTGTTRKARVQRVVTVLAGAFFLLAGVMLAPGAAPASAATPLAVSQCDYDSNTPGLLIICDVTVNNYQNVATGAESSSTVVKACRGAANTAPSSCTVSTLPSTFVVTSVNQCNNSVNGGGSTLACSVTIINNVTGGSGLTGVSVNQCIGTGGGGGTSTTICNPTSSTSSATVTQCNGSANGGGGDGRGICTVTSGDGAALPVSINQCNGSANGGGSTVTCSTSVRNIVTAAAATPVNKTGGTTGGAASQGTPVAAAAGSAASGSTLTSDDRAFGEIAASRSFPSASSTQSARAIENAAAASAAAAAAAQRAVILAFTGANIVGAVLIGIAAMVAGAVLFGGAALRRKLRMRAMRLHPKTA